MKLPSQDSSQQRNLSESFVDDKGERQKGPLSSFAPVTWYTQPHIWRHCPSNPDFQSPGTCTKKTPCTCLVQNCLSCPSILWKWKCRCYHEVRRLSILPYLPVLETFCENVRPQKWYVSYYACLLRILPLRRRVNKGQARPATEWHIPSLC